MRITRCTKNGQITIPIDARSQWSTDTFIIKYDQKSLTITPVFPEDLQEEVIFDANLDNNGQGLAIDDMLKLLKKIKKNG